MGNEQKIGSSEDKFSGLLKMIFSTQEEDITCEECYEHVDEYVDMLQAGQDPAQVLPQVKNHLEQCRCCTEELQALISILESESDTDSS